MGHIAEPNGIDFIIQSKKLTNEERKEISDFIAKRKVQLEESNKNQRRMKKPTANKRYAKNGD